MEDTIDIINMEIGLGISTGIIQKWKLDHATDMQLLLKLFEFNETHLAIKIMLLAHHFPNWKVLEKLIMNAAEGWTFDRLFFSISARRDEYNTLKFHQEMAKVTSDYAQHGGFQLHNTNKGPAAEMFADPDQLYRLVEPCFAWLTQTSTSHVDTLFDVIKLPGHHGYWLEHLVRWCFFVRTRHFKLATQDSKKYLSMTGCQLAYGQFFKTPFDIKTIEELYIDFEPFISYSDFGCLLCELYRMDSEFKKYGYNPIVVLDILRCDPQWKDSIKRVRFGSNASARERTRFAIAHLIEVSSLTEQW